MTKKDKANQEMKNQETPTSEQREVEETDGNVWNERLFGEGNAAIAPVEQRVEGEAVEQRVEGEAGKEKDKMKPHIFTMRIEDGKMERIDAESTDIEQDEYEGEQIDYDSGDYLDRKTLAKALNVTAPTILNMINDYLTPEEKEYLVIMTYRGLKKKYYHRPEILKILKERLHAERKKRAKI
ncbi:MAG: hypothetical protein BWY32_03793 [bacterium ADurb.Bin243]|nr:MAG: hypothetical protein BWY32_03793 [bacterium ADurb.Bin243]